MDTINDIGLLIKLIHDSIGTIVNTKLKEDNITISQLQLLSFLLDRKGNETSIGEIEEFFHVKHTTVLGLVKRMESKDFIFSFINSNDKRIRNVEITDLGESIIKNADEKKENFEKEYMNGLTLYEKENLRKSLVKINSNLQKLKEQL